MSSKFIEACRDVVTWVRVPRRSAGAAVHLTPQAPAAVQPAVHPIIHIYPNPAGAASSNAGGHFHRVGARLRHVGMKKVVALVCTISGGIAGAALLVDKVVLRVAGTSGSTPLPTQVSEPSSLYLLAFGIVALGFGAHWVHRKLKAVKA